MSYKQLYVRMFTYIYPMKYIEGQNRTQITLFPITLDDSIDQDNEARLIDLFVSALNINDLGFRVDHIENGRPAYHPKDLLRIYIYGYMNSIRSSRNLEKECKRNLEMIWLVKGLAPDHNTISNFRRDNPKSIKKVFQLTVKIASHFNLIGGKLIAGDSTKLRAQNSKKNNFNEKKINRHLEYIERKLAEYTTMLSECDGDKNRKEIEQEISKHENRKEDYLQLQEQLNQSGATQISTSDPESRQMITRNNITEVAYNIQTTVDAENYIPFDYVVTNTNDSKAMGMMLQRAKDILKTNEFTALYDKGYHTGSEFKIAADLGIDVLVAIPTVAAQAPNPAYNVEHFIYHQDADCYECPEGKELHTTGTLHKAKTYMFKRYTTKDCLKCPVKAECSKAKYGKAIQRSEYQEVIDNNKIRIAQNKGYYRHRQAIVEHPYGTVKRQWGFNYIMTKKYKHRAAADVGFIFTVYNLKRIINLVDTKELEKYLKELVLSVFNKTRLPQSKRNSYKTLIFMMNNSLFFNKVA